MNYDFIENYTMKCRLYVNEAQKELIQKALAGVRTYYNCTMYAILHDLECTVEKVKKDKSGNEGDGVVHFPKLSLAQDKEWKKKLIKDHPIIECVPAGALTGNNGCIGADMAKAFGKLPVEAINHNIEYKKSIKKSKALSKEEKKKKLNGVVAPSYYSKDCPRTSYTYQETCSKIERAENRNVFYITLNKIGRCKVRGWNQKIRFDEDGALDFLDYCEIDKRKKITVTISVDNCGDHYICFKLQNVYKPMSKKIDKEVGADVGIVNLVTLSDGEKFENKRFKDAEKKNARRLKRKLSRRQGWSNDDFREAHKKDPELKPSKSYERTLLKHSKLNRKIERRRANYNHEVTRKIVEKNGKISVKTLDVVKMFQNKHVSDMLSDAAIGTVIEQLKYKSAWHGREIVLIDQWAPTSKKCSRCGHVVDNLSLKRRQWRCPICKTVHDVDVNAAKNILNYAFYPELAG